MANTVGVLGYDFNLYRIFPTAGATYTAVNPRPASPEPVPEPAPEPPADRALGRWDAVGSAGHLRGRAQRVRETAASSWGAAR